MTEQWSVFVKPQAVAVPEAVVVLYSYLTQPFVPLACPKGVPGSKAFLQAAGGWAGARVLWGFWGKFFTPDVRGAVAGALRPVSCLPNPPTLAFADQGKGGQDASLF